MAALTVEQVFADDQVKWLGIETSSELCSVALLSAAKIDSRSITGARVHTAHLLPFVQELLDSANMTMAELDGVAVGAGPGAFTGVRVGFAAAQGICQAISKPMIAVSSLKVLAAEAWLSCNETEVVTIIDARMSQVYAAEFSLNQNGLADIVVDDQLLAPELLSIKTVASQAYVGTGVEFCNQEQSAGELTEDAMLPRLLPSARGLLVAAKVFGIGGSVDLKSIEPNYLRNDVAKKSKSLIK